MKTILTFEAGHRWVEALVTFAIMGWFAVALVGMAAEAQLGPSAPLRAAALPQSPPSTQPTPSSAGRACGTGVQGALTR